MSCASTASSSGSSTTTSAARRSASSTTEVEPGFEGGGLAGRLARYSLDDARKRQLAVLPFCLYVQSWIKRHPEYADLVPQDRRAEFDL